jgi:hypothetical protein
VNCFPATVQITRLPRRASARSELALIEPSGNASSAAFASRNFVSGVIAAGSMEWLILAMFTHYPAVTNRLRAGARAGR